MDDSILQMINSTLRVSTPLLFAAIGGMISERSGVINIALEGIMLCGAFTAAAVSLATQSAPAGAAAAVLCGLLVAAAYAFFVIEIRADQIVAGIAVNMFAAGATAFLCKILYQSSTSTPSLALEYRFQSAPVWMAGGVVILAWAWMKYSPLGLWVRFAGEHPEALDSAGIGVKRVRWFAVLLSGVLSGMAGASLSIFLASSFTRNMTSGRGFMALAAMIFGKWKPIPAALACLFFGFSDALQIRLQGVVLWGSEPVPVQFIQILPYLVTILVLAGVVGQSRAPKALGLPFRSS
ncbi:MAG: ABC transporter permease [Bdellovibrio sp.]|nr:ABC transporter permease [Bdellovibrio sp.]